MIGAAVGYLNVFPIVVGRGRRSFDDTAHLVSLSLVESTTLKTRMLGLAYKPVISSQ